MGTNYYWHRRQPCKECGRPIDEPIHIGKSSAGWCFSLHVHHLLGIRSLHDWKVRFDVEGSRIENEYGDRVSKYEMLKVITEREWQGMEKGPEWYRKNDAVPGPRGLARHRLDKHCVGYGEGSPDPEVDETWDLIHWEFS